jgi:PKD repeat protein
LTVTETIHTDDLQTPTIVKQTKVSVSATGTSPTAVLEGPTEVVLGGGSSERLIYGESGGLELVDTPTLGEAGFDASASSASTAQGSNRIVAYHWTFGDGHAETTTTATVEHTYELPGAYGVQLTVTDAHGLSSEPVSLIVEVKTAPPSASSGVSTGTTGTTGTTGGAVAGQTPAGLSSSATGPSSSAAAGGLTPALPDVTLKNATLEVARTGTVTLELECPSGESRCRGTVTLRTLGAGGARNARSSTGASTGSSHAEKSHSAGTTIASGAFTIAGGRAKTVTLALTAKARSLLAHSHVLHARATILAHDPAGATHTTQRAVTLRVTKLGTR